MSTARRRSLTALIATLAFSSVTSAAVTTPATEIVQTSSHIVQAASLETARAAVQAAGGTVTHELGIIEAVASQLTVAQADALRANPGLILSADASTTVAGVSPSYAVRQTMANALHAAGITGKDVSIAFVVTGLWATPLAGYDAIRNVESTSIADDNGHGTHVTSIAASANLTAGGTYLGIAPGASWVAVKAFGADGRGTYANTIRGLDWILANRTKHNIRVVNMSFGATPQMSTPSQLPNGCHHWQLRWPRDAQAQPFADHGDLTLPLCAAVHEFAPADRRTDRRAATRPAVKYTQANGSPL